MKKIKILILATIMTLSICATAIAAEVNTTNVKSDTVTTQKTDPEPW